LVVVVVVVVVGRRVSVGDAMGCWGEREGRRMGRMVSSSGQQLAFRRP
jgi:hypothetical protein